MFPFSCFHSSEPEPETCPLPVQCEEDPVEKYRAATVNVSLAQFQLALFKNEPKLVGNDFIFSINLLSIKW